MLNDKSKESTDKHR